MPRIGISYTDVENAISYLQGQQKLPTVENIRSVIKSGSNSTISRLLREWKSKNGVGNADEAGVPHELLQLIRGLWDRVQENADQKIDAHQSEADCQVENAKNK